MPPPSVLHRNPLDSKGARFRFLSLAQYLQENIARSRRPQQRLPAVTTTGDEVQVVEAVAPLQGMFHPAHPRAPFAKSAKGCGTHPLEGGSRFGTVWYYPLRPNVEK